MYILNISFFSPLVHKYVHTRTYKIISNFIEISQSEMVRLKNVFLL